jgi:hypothetical protein
MIVGLENKVIAACRDLRCGQDTRCHNTGRADELDLHLGIGHELYAVQST